MSTRSSPRNARKRLRQATLTSTASGSEGRKRGKLAATVPKSRGTWNDEVKGLMIFEPDAWKPDKNSSFHHPNALHKVAAFDLDSTLITTKTRAKFPKSAQDWKILYPRAGSMLEELAASGHVLVIFTNQAGVSTGRINEAFIKSRVEGIMATIKPDIGVLVATTKDNHRKPATGMWDVFVELMGGPDHIDMKNSFYVGDAAGRPARNGFTADFSDSDLRFSINVGVRFHTPEEYFLGRKDEAVSTTSISGFDPRPLVAGKGASVYITNDADLDNLLRSIVTPVSIVQDFDMGSSTELGVPSVQTLILMHGFPASGKTTFVKRHLIPRGYVWINQDSMQTFARCSRVAKEALAQGKSVVIDNTNPNRSARAKFIELGKAHDMKLKVITLSMQTSKEVAQHLNIVRERESMGTIAHIPTVAYHAYSKRVEAPELAEGITKTATVKFLPSFESEQQKYMFTRLT